MMIFGKRGFVTIATGSERYFKIAENLLLSYRINSSVPYPFAIITDRENEITSKFDNVIILDNPSRNYNDKLRLFEYLPYEETIFIDADCLAYGDLNLWWDMFAEAGDFSCFGYAYEDLSATTGWFIPSGMGEYADKIKFIPTFNGGIYYLRNTEICKKVFETANECAKNYNKYSFLGFSKPADEPLLALGMAVCNCEPVNREEFLFAPRPDRNNIDILVPKAVNKKNANMRLIHWSNYLTDKSFYRCEVWKLRRKTEKGFRQDSLKYKLQYFLHSHMYVYDLTAFAGRVLRKLKKMLKRK